MHLKILVLNGPNLNMLGSREPEIYGKAGLDALERQLKQTALQNQVGLDFFQSNSEGTLIDYIHRSEGVYDCVILNAGAYTHYSIALRDAISAVHVPVIEVHISNIYAREEFRHTSILAPVTIGQISGFGFVSYTLALMAALQLKGGGKTEGQE